MLIAQDVSITITETPPAANFTISPNTYNFNCGTTTSQTFTINNLNNTPDIREYKWEFPSNNGWLHNGIPASTLISTGLTNSITLTPACGEKPKDFRGYVYTSPSGPAPVGTGYYTNFITVSVSPPSYTITGLTTLCSGSNDYTINGLVCNSTVLWTAPPSNLANFNSLSTSPSTLTAASGSSGNLTLTANVTSCGETTPVTLPIHVGAYTSSDFILSGNNGSPYWCSNQTISFGASGVNGVPGATGTNYSWTIPTGWTTVYNGGSYVAIRSPSSTYPPTGTLSVSFTEPCGTTITKSTFLAYSSTACTGTDPRYTYSPNPAPYYLNVAVASSYIGSAYIRKIELISLNTGQSVYYQDYTYGNVTSTTITMSGLPTGTYTLRIYDGTAWSAYTIMH